MPFDLLADRRQDPRPRFEYSGRHLLVDRRAADQDLLLGRQQGLGELRIATGDPADPQAGQPVGLRHRGDAQHARVRGRPRWATDRRRRAHGKSRRRAAARGDGVRRSDQPLEALAVDHRSGRIVGIGDADQPGLGPQHRLEPIEIEGPAVLEAQVDGLDVGRERPRAFRGWWRSWGWRSARGRLARAARSRS